MKKNLLYILTVILILISSPGFAQETAMDFETTDCDGQYHHLFSELDEGKVILVEFVMLNCSPCIVATKSLTSIVSAYEQTDPGRVKIYSFGFLDIYKCDHMQAWRSGGSFTLPVFVKGANQVEYYGGMGMPTFIITGTDAHKVFYKSIYGYNQSMDTEIKAAIDSALLYSPLGNEEKIVSDMFSVYPTVFTNDFSIRTDNVPSSCVAVIYNVTGTKLFTKPVLQQGITTINGTNLPTGMLIMRLESNEGISKGFKLIKQ